jgi:RNA recognition motif-containing protein
LNFQTTDRELREAMQEVGQVTDVHIPKDRDTGQPRGFAFVEFAEASQASAAIQRFDGKELGGRPLRVNEAQERRPRPASGPRPRPSYPSFENDGWGNDRGGPGGGYAGGGGGRPSRPKGSRKGMRGKKRSL